jgi:hypothetical protein
VGEAETGGAAGAGTDRLSLYLLYQWSVYIHSNLVR